MSCHGSWCGALLAAALLASTARAGPFEASFFPYRDGFPSYPALAPGLVIDQDNVEQFREILDSATYRYVRRGWYSFDVIATEEFTLHPGYIEASRENPGKVALDENGLLVNYTAGRAFPEPPDPDDPKAGLKLVWGYQYGLNAGDSETIHPFWWTFRDLESGDVERQLHFEWHFLNWAHRVMFAPKPEFPNNPSQIFRSIYGRVLKPFDLKDTQLLIHRYKNDLERDDAWLYLGFQRRVRRLATGQVTDAFLGTDLMIEDFEGYNGRVSDYTWEYGGTRDMMVPFYRHDAIEERLEPEAPGTQDGYRFVRFGGQGGCFPQVPWQLRRIHLLIGKPKDPNHPLSRREIYLDAETAVMPVLHVFDRKGDFWKSFYICKSHPDHHLPQNEGAGVPIETCAVLIDEQARHCTTLQFRSMITPEGNDPSQFTVQNLRKRGR